MLILILVCARIKNNTHSASNFLLKGTVNPLTNARDTYKNFGIGEDTFLGKGR